MRKVQQILSSIKEDEDDYYMHEGGDDAHKDKYAKEQEEALNNFSAPDGMNRDRSCTDCFCSLVFIAFLGSMIYLTFLGYSAGEIPKLLAPVNGDFTLCGWKNDTNPDKTYDNMDYPNLLITDWSNPLPTALFASSVCVKECPTSTEDVPEFQPTANVQELPTEGGLEWKVQSYAIMQMCIPLDPPSSVLEAVDAAKSALLDSAAGAYIEDMQRASRSIYVSLAMAVVYSIVFIYILSLFGETIAWICIVIIQVAMIAASAIAYFAWQAQVDKFNKLEETVSAEGLEEEQTKQQKMVNIYLGVMIVAALLTVGFACCLCCNYSSLKIAIDCIDAAADFLAGNKLIITVPGFFFILSIISVMVWIGSMMAIVSMSHIEVNENIIQGKNIIMEEKLKYMCLYMLFGILWVTAFFEYCSTFVIMVSASTYYFNSDMHTEGDAEVSLGFTYCFTHFGSIAIGSFIIALIRFIRIVFMYAAKQAEKQSGDNPAVKMIVACAACVLACIEKICDYINSSAYAYQAVSGDSFCTSAWNAFLLQIKHMAEFAFANLIAKVFILLGKIGITAGNMVSCYYIMKLIFKDFEGNPEKNDQPISSPLAPIAFVGAVSFLTASIFLGILDTAVLSLLTCRAMDEDKNGKGECKFGPPTFHDKAAKMHENFLSASEQKAAMEEGGEIDKFAAFEKQKDSILYTLMR